VSKHSKRRQSRLGRVGQKPTDERRGTATMLSHEDAQAILNQRGVRLVETVRQGGGLRYNIVHRRKPRTLKVVL
jgi:hypothetical protein